MFIMAFILSTMGLIYDLVRFFLCFAGGRKVDMVGGVYMRCSGWFSLVFPPARNRCRRSAGFRGNGPVVPRPSTKSRYAHNSMSM